MIYCRANLYLTGVYFEIIKQASHNISVLYLHHIYPDVCLSCPPIRSLQNTFSIALQRIFHEVFRVVAQDDKHFLAKMRRARFEHNSRRGANRAINTERA